MEVELEAVLFTGKQDLKYRITSFERHICLPISSRLHSFDLLFIEENREFRNLRTTLHRLKAFLRIYFNICLNPQQLNFDIYVNFFK